MQLPARTVAGCPLRRGDAVRYGAQLMSQANAFDRGSDIAPDEQEFLVFVARHFDSAYYLQSYADAANAGLDPLQHWLDSGALEGRQISRSVDLRFGKAARRSSNRIWKHYRWRGTDVAARLTKPLPPEVMRQIFDQARHDPAVLAAGRSAIANLIQQDRENVHIDVAGLQRALPRGTELLLIAPNLDTLGVRGFTADLAEVLGGSGFGAIRTIVADQESPASVDRSAMSESIRSAGLLFWHDFWIHGPEAVNLGQLAQLISVLRPRITIVAGSRRGYEMVARFGRGLSERAKLYCAYIVDAEGFDLGARFAARTLPFATALTDDIALADRLREQNGDGPGREIVALPRHSRAAFRDAVIALFARR